MKHLVKKLMHSAGIIVCRDGLLIGGPRCSLKEQLVRAKELGNSMVRVSVRGHDSNF